LNNNYIELNNAEDVLENIEKLNNIIYKMENVSNMLPYLFSENSLNL